MNHEPAAWLAHRPFGRRGGWRRRRAGAITAGCVALLAGCGRSSDEFARNHRAFHEEHAAFVSARAEDVNVQFARLVEWIGDERDPADIAAHWRVVLGTLTATVVASEVYSSNCLVRDETRSILTGMQRARAEIDVTVLTNRTELESAIRRGDRDEAYAVVAAIREVVMDQLRVLVDGSRAYLSALDAR